MSQPAPRNRLSVLDYLAGEDGAEIRHEYIDGQLYAMTGASDRHGLITGNILAALRPLIRGTPCQLFANDMKVRLNISRQDIFYYPDLLLSCDPTDRETYYRSRPCLLSNDLLAGPGSPISGHKTGVVADDHGVPALGEHEQPLAVGVTGDVVGQDHGGHRTHHPCLPVAG